MKKIVCAVLCLCCLFACMPAVSAADADVTVDGTWSIRLPASPNAYERFAADTLRSALSQVFGVSVTAAANAAAPYIAVGAAAKADVSGMAANGYRIQVIDGCIHIDGTGQRGLQIGAYRFLETFCGRKVYTSEITVLPTASEIRVPADTDICYEPFFEYTETDWRTADIAEYSLSNGLFGGIYRTLPAEAGGTVRYLGSFAHTMGTLCETEKYKDTHPEYLALHDGVRTASQPCLSNPDVLAIATENVLGMLRQGHDPNASVQIVSVTQNDNCNYCQCPDCKAFDDAHGGEPSASILRFVNAIADTVKAAGYDNVAIDTFAYQYSRRAPEGIVPRENVIVRLCTIECCFCHALDDASCPRNTALMQDLRDWTRICKRLYIWDYTTNYANTCLVFPDFGVIQRNLQVFYENNVRGVYEEGNFYLPSCDAEFGDLRMYMIAKCLQDPYCALDSEINGFLAAYYGAGWTHIRQAIDLYTQHAGGKNGHLGIYDNAEQSMRLSNRDVRVIDGCWDAAAAKADTDLQRTRIARSALSWRFWKASVNQGEFSLLNPERFAERETLFEDLQSFGVTTISEGGDRDYLDCICIRYAPADHWNGYEADSPSAQRRLFFGRILEALLPLLMLGGLPYRLLQQTGSTAA